MRCTQDILYYYFDASYSYNDATSSDAQMDELGHFKAETCLSRLDAEFDLRFRALLRPSPGFSREIPRTLCYFRCQRKRDLPLVVANRTAKREAMESERIGRDCGRLCTVAYFAYIARFIRKLIEQFS
jgi:hypothetical protein